MSKFAQGKFAYATSDRSGVRYKYKDMRKEWNGLLVGPDEYEEKHPQLSAPNVGADPQALRDPRPDVTEGLKVFVYTDTVGLPIPRPQISGRVGQVTVSTS